MTAPPTDPRAIYAPTAAGTAELTTPGGAVNHVARRLLVLIDGARDLQSLAPYVRVGELDALVADLLARGLIRLAGRSQPPDPEQQQAMVRAEAAALARAKRMCAAVLSDELGEAGHVWAARVEDAVDREVLRRVVRDGIEVLFARSGEAAARRAVAALKPLLGPQAG